MQKFELLEYTKEKYVTLYSPLKVYLDISGECNLDCIFCYKRKGNKFDYASMIQIIDKLADANVLEVIFVGGEPMLCEDLIDVAKHAQRKGIIAGMITNGTLFTQENIGEICDVFGNNIAVSFHGNSNEIYKKITLVDNVYDEVIKGFKLLNANGVKPGVLFTPNKYNQDLLYKSIDNLLSMGIDITALYVNRLIPSTSIINSWEKIKLKEESQNLLLQEMEKLTIKYPNVFIGTGDAIPYCEIPEEYRKFVIRCDYGITIAWVDEKGYFGKCMCRNGNNGLENIFEKDIVDIWNNSPMFVEYRKMEFIPNHCKICSYLEVCGGGCSCSSTDPNCYIDSFIKKDEAIDNQEIEGSSLIHKIQINENQHVTSKFEFLLRKEKQTNDIEDPSKYLCIPRFPNQSIVNDTINESEDIDMLWLSEVEKEVLIALSRHKAVNIIKVAKHISLIFNISMDKAILQTSDVVKNLIFHNYVEVKI